MREAMAQPDVMPILSPGRHRSPRRGACFMELASYLAGDMVDNELTEADLEHSLAGIPSTAG